MLTTQQNCWIPNMVNETKLYLSLPGWKTFHHWPGASPAIRLGAILWQDQGNLSTAVNVANLARAPGFQHCLEPDYVTHRSIITRLKNFPSPTRSLASHKTGCNSMARSGKSFNGRQCCQPGTGARFSTLSGTRLCDPQEYNYQVEKLSITDPEPPQP